MSNLIAKVLYPEAPAHRAISWQELMARGKCSDAFLERIFRRNRGCAAEGALEIIVNNALLWVLNIFLILCI